MHGIGAVELVQSGRRVVAAHNKVDVESEQLGDSIVVHGMVEVEPLLQAKVMQPRHRWSSQQQVDVAVVVVLSYVFGVLEPKFLESCW
jgi:hypothetical protein